MDTEVPQFERVSWKRSGLLERAPNGNRWWWWLLPLLAIPALLFSAWWLVDHIEGDTEEAARGILEDRGLGNLDVEASYRSVDVTGEIPEGSDATPELIEQWLEEGEDEDVDGDIINADTSALLVAAPAALVPIAVDVISDGESIVLEGTVPSESHRDELVDSAEATGLPVTDNLTVVGGDPSADDADGQIQQLAGVVGGLGGGAIIAANLSLDDDSLSGNIQAADADAEALLQPSAGSGVDVTSPAALGALDTTVDYDGSSIVLDGTVLTEAQAGELGDAAASVVGADNVTNNLVVSGLDEAVPDADGRVAALAGAIGTFGGLDSADATMNDTDLTVNGVASDEASRDATVAVVAAAEGAAALRPGGEITVPEPELTLQEEIDLLQAELDALQEEISETVVFASNSDVLSAPAQATLNKVVAAMQRYPRPVVEVGGHTDSQGPDAFNLDLSQRRAQSVVDFVGGQTSPDRLNPIGFGETQPVADNTLEEGRLANRRVEFTAKESF